MRMNVDALISRGGATPYQHLFHVDGSPYMGRYWLMPKAALKLVDEPIFFDGVQVGVDSYFELKPLFKGLPAARLHNIQSRDLDLEMHNHPWPFLSRVLRGGYVERRPASRTPIFYRNDDSLWEETGVDSFRGPGSWAYRTAGDRHRIVSVEPHTWTLVITGPKVQSWGFHTRDGFVKWEEFIEGRS